MSIVLQPRLTPRTVLDDCYGNNDNEHVADGDDDVGGHGMHVHVSR